MVTCDGGVGFSEGCADLPVSTLDDLVAAVDRSGLTQLVREAAALDGERAVILRADPADPSSTHAPVAYVLAVHRERPWVIQLSGRPAGIELAGLDDIMTGFSFLDPEDGGG